MTPPLAVLMAAYNAEKTIRQAVESLSAETVAFDLFVVDDCSRIPVSHVPMLPQAHVEIVRLEKNVGPARARNAGLSRILANGYRYVAIMDADDVSARDRLSKQVAFLEDNPHIAAVGTAARFIDENNGATIFHYRPPLEPESIRKALAFNSCFVHPTVMIRTEALACVGVYSEHYPAAEDYELMQRISSRFDLANLPEYLLNYRISSNGVSMTRRRRQLFDRLRIQLKYFQPLRLCAWTGIAVSLALLVFPVKWILALKAGKVWRPPVLKALTARAKHIQPVGGSSPAV